MNWDDYRFFAEVVRAGSIRSAARSLSVAHTVVSRRIARLEEFYATRLLVRTAGGVELTEAGEELHKATTLVSQEVQSIERRILGDEDELDGPLRMTLYPAFGLGLLMPELSLFRGNYPGIELQLSCQDKPPQLIAEEAELALYLGREPSAEWVSQRVCGLAYAVYGEENYLLEHDPVAKPKECSWIGWSPQESYPSHLKQQAFAELPIWGEFAGVRAQFEAVTHGLGLAALPCLLADGEPRLRRLSAPEIVDDIYLCCHPSQQNTSRVRHAWNFFVERIQARQNTLEGREDSSQEC